LKSGQHIPDVHDSLPNHFGNTLPARNSVAATHTVSDVWRWDDPLPALGVLYPLAVFMKNGKVSTELLVSEEPVPAPG
jgi:hypothetical protein